MREFRVRLDGIEETLREIKGDMKEARAESASNSAKLQLDFQIQTKESRAESKADIAALCKEFQDTSKEILTEMKLSFHEVRGDMRLSQRVEKIERTIQAEQKEQ
jgi:hypothetical protein